MTVAPIFDLSNFFNTKLIGSISCSLSVASCSYIFSELRRMGDQCLASECRPRRDSSTEAMSFGRGDLRLIN